MKRCQTEWRRTRYEEIRHGSPKPSSNSEGVRRCNVDGRKALNKTKKMSEMGINGEWRSSKVSTGVRQSIGKLGVAVKIFFDKCSTLISFVYVAYLCSASFSRLKHKILFVTEISPYFLVKSKLKAKA